MKPLPILAFTVAAVIGWLVAGNPARPEKPTPLDAAAPRDVRPERRASKSRGPAGIAGQRLAAIRASRDPAARMRATVDLASTLSPAEFADWMDGGWFAVAGVELTLFTKIIEERWINEDPEGFLVWAQKNRSSRARDMLASWARTDPRRVLEFYKNHPNDSAEMQDLNGVAKTDPALALQRFQELAASMDSSNLEYHIRNVLSVLAEKSPTQLEAALDSLPTKVRLLVETTLVGRRMKGSFDEEYLKLQQRPDGIKLMKEILNSDIDSKDRNTYRNAILADLANLPPSWIGAIAANSYGFVTNDNAEQWISADLENSGFTADQAKRIRTNALGNLYNKPEVALRLLTDVEMEENNRENLLGNIFRNLGGDADKAEKLIAMLGSEEDREAARGFFKPKTEDVNPILDNPADWLASLAELDLKNGGGTFRHNSAVEEWDAAKVADLKRQFNGLPNETKGKVANNLLAQDYSNPSPIKADAIRYLLENPEPAPEGTDSTHPRNTPEGKNIQLASKYVGQLARTDPTAAGTWIASLPDGQPKLWAQKNLHSLWSQYDPAAAEEWFGTLPAATRESVGKLGNESR
jgi:hypothetical protein